MDKQRTVLEVVSEISGIAREALEPRMDLVADLGIDSPKALQLLLELEERLGIEISDEDAAKLDAVGDILEFVAAG